MNNQTNYLKMGLEDTLYTMGLKEIGKKLITGSIITSLSLGSVSVHKTNAPNLETNQGPLAQYVIKAGFNESEAKTYKAPDVLSGNAFLISKVGTYLTNTDFQTRIEEIKDFQKQTSDKSISNSFPQFLTGLILGVVNKNFIYTTVEKENPAMGRFYLAYLQFKERNFNSSILPLTTSAFEFAQELGYNPNSNPKDEAIAFLEMSGPEMNQKLTELSTYLPKEIHRDAIYGFSKKDNECNNAYNFAQALAFVSMSMYKIDDNRDKIIKHSPVVKTVENSLGFKIAESNFFKI